MHTQELNEIAEGFIEKHGDYIEDNKLKSWARKVGIKLENNGTIDQNGLFHLFVLAMLWNNPGTYGAKKGEEVFKSIGTKYTLENYVEASRNALLSTELNSAHSSLWNPNVFNTLSSIATGYVGGERVWAKILRILTAPTIGNKESDTRRLELLYDLFNPWQKERAYFTVKVFLIFREIRIQFRTTGKLQYHPAICCVPDSRVRNALKKLNLIDNVGNDLGNLELVSAIVSENFCTPTYELYDLPLFFWYREG